MRSLRKGAEDYLTLRRGLGFKLKRPARFVRGFVESLEKRGEKRITTQLALEWRRSLNISNLRSGWPV